MKKIEATAIKLANELSKGYDNPNYNQSVEFFKEGVEFAQQWIDIEDELPEANKDEKGILYSDYVLIKVRGYEHPFIGYYVKACDDEFFDFISEIISKSIKQVDITRWRPIEYK